jgi:hypothetical protein
MFWYLMDVLALKKLGLARPIRYLLLSSISACLAAGIIYAYIVVHAISERNNSRHVSKHRLR